MRFLRYALLGLALLAGNSACLKEQSTHPDSILGQWDFDGLYYDIGDGSGQFQSFPSGLILVFEADGVVSSNGPVCLLVSQPVSPSSGRYDEATNTLHFTRCNGFDVDITLNYTRLGDELIISKPDYSPDCAQRFLRKGTKARS
jgi:hypothetical protein